MPQRSAAACLSQLHLFPVNYRPWVLLPSANAGLKTHAELYPSTGYHDELAWAATWLYKATQEGTFLTAAMALFNDSQADGNSACCGYGTFSWDTKSPGKHFHS